MKLTQRIGTFILYSAVIYFFFVVAHGDFYVTQWDFKVKAVFFGAQIFGAVLILTADEDTPPY